jgi:hypothetical protein
MIYNKSGSSTARLKARHSDLFSHRRQYSFAQKLSILTTIDMLMANGKYQQNQAAALVQVDSSLISRWHKTRDSIKAVDVLTLSRIVPYRLTSRRFEERYDCEARTSNASSSVALYYAKESMV